MSRGKRRKSEVAFDLLAIRKLKRLTRRVVAGLEDIEKHLVRIDRADRQAGSQEEVALAIETHRLIAEHVDKTKRPIAAEECARHPLVEE